MHIICSTASGSCWTQPQVDAAVEDLKNSFQGTQITFTLNSTEFITDNDVYNGLTSISTLIDNVNHRIHGTIDVFVTKGGTGEGNQLERWCWFPKINYLPSRTFAHEIGHTLGLLHTFDTACGTENIHNNSDCPSNAATAGDFVTDTDADRLSTTMGNLTETVPGNPSTCTWVHGDLSTIADACGKSNYQPPFSNYMGYYISECIPSYSFTQGQIERMHWWIATQEKDLTSTSTVNVTFKKTVNGGDISSSSPIKVSGGGLYPERLQQSYGTGSALPLFDGQTYIANAQSVFQTVSQTTYLLHDWTG